MKRKAAVKTNGNSLRVTLSRQGFLRLAVRCAIGLPLLSAAASVAAAPFGSAQWFSQAASIQSSAPASGQTPGGMPAIPGRVVKPEDALKAAQKSIYDLTRATQTIIAARDAQNVAHQQALLSAQGLIPDGLGDGGLLASVDAADDASCVASNSCVWQNAELPVQTAGQGSTSVKVKQLAKKAILTWDSFNIGANTTLYFDQHLGTQQDGNNDWVALNRITAGSSPSQILGKIRAEGSVYLINPNGIIFGGSSQVDVHSLLASSLPLYLPKTATTLLPGDDADYLQYSNRLFLESGLASVGNNAAAGNILGINSGQNVSLADNIQLPGDITFEKGAILNVSKLGYALMAASNINNAGIIRATDGQVILAAGLGLSLKNAAGGSLLLQPVVSGRINDVGNANADVTPVGTVTNTGIIESTRGDIRLLGGAIVQDGVVAVSSSISRPGSIGFSALDEQSVDNSRARTGSLVLKSGSVTAILPDGNGETTISSPAATQQFKTGSINMVGAAVTLQGKTVNANGETLPGALVEAPGQNVAVTAIAQNDANIAPRAIRDGSIAGRVYLDDDATIDVAGIADNQLDMSVNFVTIPRLGLNELADSPLQRDSILFGASVIIDSRVLGTRADGTQWVGTPLANLTGYVQQIKRDINRMLVNAGNIDLAGGEVIQRQGSVLNLNAGYTHFLASNNLLKTTRLVADNGAVVDIGQADSNANYVGFAGKTVDKSSRWNITTIASDPLGMGGAYQETDYIDGGNAGQLSIYGAVATLLDGGITAQALAGRHQVALGIMPVGGKLYLGTGKDGALFNRVYPDSPPVHPAQSYLVVEDTLTLASIASSASMGAFNFDSVLPTAAAPVSDQSNWQHWTQVSAHKIRDGGFSVVNVVADDPAQLDQGGEIAVAQGTTLSVQNGGSITLTGSRIAVNGNLSARAGNIALTATGRTDRPGTTVYAGAGNTPVAGNIVVSGQSRLDARGEWINDGGRAEDDIMGGAFINGGSVSLKTVQASTAGTLPGQVIDTTGSIILQSGSVIDVSSGARLLPSGSIAGGLVSPSGRGGNIVLETYVPAKLNFGDIGSPALPTENNPPHSGTLQLGGSLKGFGFNGGGTLSLRTLGLQIGGVAQENQPWNLVLPESFFSVMGFDNIVLQSEYNALIAANTTLNLHQSGFAINNLDGLRDLASGSDFLAATSNSPAAVSVQINSDEYRRHPLNLSVFAGDYVNWVNNNFASPNYSAAGINGAVTLGTNASIFADAGAAVTLGSNTQVTVLGSIVAHGGRITLTGDTANGGYVQQPGVIGTAYTSDSKSIWLGADSLLDASGTVLLDPLATGTHADGTPVRHGRVLDGGTVTLTNDTGYIIARSCTDADAACTSGHKATINVSGKHALLDLSDPGLYTSGLQSVDVGSNAGTVRLGAGNGLFFNGSIFAKAGNATAEGGTLLVTPENGRIRPTDGSSGALRLEVFGHVLKMPVASIELADSTGPYNVATQVITATTVLQPGDDISGAPFPYLTADWQEIDVTPGVLQFSTTLLNGSGITTLRLGSDPVLNTAQIPVPVVFTDNTSINMGRELSINASIITATPPQTVQVIKPPAPAPGDDPEDPVVNLLELPIDVSLRAPYVRLTGLRYGGNYAPLVDDLRFGDKATLSVNATAAMDVGGQIRMDNWGEVNLTSAGDLRFITPSTYAYLGDPGNVAKVIRSPGLLETTANLNITAAQIYPATDERFIIQAHPTYQSIINVTIEDGEEVEADPTAPVFIRGSVNIRGYATKAAPALPFSVGGSLVVDAKRISQGGIVRAPGGQIVLGLGTSAMENNEAWDAASLAWLDYTALDDFGDAKLVHMASVQDLKYNRVLKGVSTEQVDLEERTDLPLIATEKVTFAANSETSVSLGGLVMPYGSTVDGRNLRYNGSQSSAARAASSTPDLTSAPAKRISSMADTVDMQTGAVIDLSGGGILQAQEWVAGTGGSRDVLAAYADGRAIYAILPGYDLKLAPYDPELVQSPLLGKTVWLSGGNGLAAGMYTLLPARYATLPGAFRLVQDSSIGDFAAANNARMPDGSLRMSGHFADAFSHASDARESAFMVQSAAVWQQYSEYHLTNLNDYFSEAARISKADWLPHDAGQLALFADKALKLSGSFRTAWNGGLGAELDIAAPALQVLDSVGNPLNDYVHLSAEAINAMGFSRLVLGGISTRTDGVDVLKASASAIDISTTKTPLLATEIIAVTQSTPGGDGIRIESGSRIGAVGNARASRASSIQIGVIDDSDESGNSTTGYNGGGALLRVSNAAMVGVNRVNMSDASAAALRIGEHSLIGGQSVTLDSTGSMTLDPSVKFLSGSLALASNAVVFSNTSSSTTSSAGLVIGKQLLDSFSNIGALYVLSRGDIGFDGNLDITTKNALFLSANNIALGSHDVTLEAPVLGLHNTAGSGTASSVPGSGSLNIITDELILGSGRLAVSQAANVDILSREHIIATGVGALDFGNAAVAMHTPLMQIMTGAGATITTSNSLVFDHAGVATTGDVRASQLGGKLNVNAGSIAVDTNVLAAGGAINLLADDDLTLGNHAHISSAGISRKAFAITQSTPGGLLNLVSANGSIDMAESAIIDVSGGGIAQGGIIGIQAKKGSVNLLGSLLGHGETSAGAAEFSVSAQNALNLDALAVQLNAGGINGFVQVSTAKGNLQLSSGHVLQAHDVKLFANGGTGSADGTDGNVIIDGTINAAGEKGGNVLLSGRSNVIVNGVVDAHGTAADRRGGTIELSTGATGDGSLNSQYGYENVSAADAGAIRVGATARLNVTGGSAGGLSGGLIRLRSALLDSGDVNVFINDGATLSGAREVSLEAYASWLTTDAGSGALHFDGIVDPAGKYSATGTLQANAGHAAFYTQTLRDFVQQPGFVFENRFSAIDGFNARAGINLVNIDNTINQGNVSVLGDWNLGAGSMGSDGLLVLDYRTHGYVAPVLKLQAAHDVLLAASLSDGFFQTNNPFGTGSTDNTAAPESSANNPLALATASLAGYTRNASGTITTVDSTSFRISSGHDIRMSGHQQTLADPDVVGGRVVLAPTMLRTGTGYISLNAVHDFALDDAMAPGIVVTAGRIAAGTDTSSADVALVDTTSGLPVFLDTGMVHPEAAGDISISVGHDINSIQSVTDTDGTRTGNQGTNLTQFWWPWMQRSCIATDDGCGDDATDSSINFGMFGQGLMSVGGNVTVRAGNMIKDLSVSLPTTWTLADNDGVASVLVYGGGDLSLTAGGDITSGSWFLGRGHGSVHAFGSIHSDIVEAAGDDVSRTLATQIALQDAVLDVVATGNIDIDGIHNPSYLFQGFDSQNYSTHSAVHLSSQAGRIVLGNESARPGESYGTSADSEGVLQRAYDYLLPATLTLDAYSGKVLIAGNGELYPSATGQFSITASGDVVFYNRRNENNTLLGMIDANAVLLPSPLNPVGDNIQSSFIDNGITSVFDLHMPESLHLHDAEPMRIYSLNGSVIDSNPFSLVDGLVISSPKRADIQAGLDIINLAFSGQNLLPSDITTIRAGRDLLNSALVPGHSVPFIELGGQGVLMVEAGRDMGPLTSTNDAYQFGYLPRLNPAYPGIRTIANQNNAWLSRTGADIAIGFGNAPGMQVDYFAMRYLDPSVIILQSGPRAGLRTTTNTLDYSLLLVSFVERYLRDEAARAGGLPLDVLTPAQAWNIFQTLPDAQRRYFVGRVFLDVLNHVGLDYGNGNSDFHNEYGRGYQAINTLFPAANGYTQNSLSGFNGAKTLVETGILDMRGSVVQTQHGGDISILGPGGRILVGSASAPQAIPASSSSAGVGPSTQGILALEKGDIGIFTDASVLLAQSRIFTEQGGGLLIWSSNGDINAGKGAKTSTEVPPAEYQCDPDHFCLVDAKSQVSGAGIAVLQTKLGSPSGDTNLVAPRGTVDAGDAGIRAAGRLNVAAFKVANADNFQVQGQSVGVPTGAVDTGALGAANAVSAAVAKVAQSVTSAHRNDETAAGILSVEVTDYGDADRPADRHKECDKRSDSHCKD